MRKFAVLLMVMLLVAIPVVNAQEDPAQGAVDWLKTQKSEEGFYGSDAIDTSLALIALALLDEPDTESLAVLETYAAEQIDILNINELALITMAVSASGGDATTFAEGVVYTNLSTKLREVRADNRSELCTGLMAINSTGAKLPVTAVAALSPLQNEDGGFSIEAGSESDVTTTLLCLHILTLTDKEEETAAAIAFLADTAAEDGGWMLGSEDEASSGFITAMVLSALTAADEDILTDWADAATFMMSLMQEDGSFESNVATTAVTALVMRGESLNSIGADEEDTEGDDTEGDDTTADLPEGPALDVEQWQVVAQGFSMDELDTADDFFVTVVDPFTQEELSGIEIVNWVAEYEYTGYIIEKYLPADVLLFLAEQDPTTWENISPELVKLLPETELTQLPEEVQALAAEE